MDNPFSLSHTNMIKGVALVLLLCNHLFVVNDWVIAPNEVVDIYVKGKPMMGYVGAFGKICVALWAFLSGYGAFFSYPNTLGCGPNSLGLGARKSIVRLWNLLLQYWIIIAVVFVPVILLLRPTFMGKAYGMGVADILQNMFSVDAEWNKAAWYMRFYILFILSMPLLIWVKLKVRNRTAWYVGMAVAMLFVPKALHGMAGAVGSLSLTQVVGEYCSYMLIVLTGYAFAEFDVFGRTQKIVYGGGRLWTLLVAGLVMVVCMGLRSYTKSIPLGVTGVMTDVVITPFVIYALYAMFVHATDGIRRVFVYLGKASMVVWLVHWIFNIGDYGLQHLAYWPRVSYLILLWTLAMCLVFQKVFSWLIKKSHILLSTKR